MYSILIIDDELYAVKALTETIDWRSLRVGKVYSTCYIDEAIQILKEKQIDILLSDIVMPGKTGFDIVEFIHEQQLSTKIIMTTAHENFWYAKKAMDLGVVDYLLKPIRFEALKQAIDSAIAEIREEEQHLQYIEKYQESCELWNQNISFVIERFWRDTLAGRFQLDRNRIVRFFRGIGRDIAPDMKFLVLLVSADEWSEESFEENIVNYGIRNMAQEVIIDAFEGAMLEDDDENNIGIIYCTDATAVKDIEAECKKFISYCNELMCVKVSCYLSEVVSPEALLGEYQDILHIYWNNLKKTNEIIRKADAEADAGISAQVPLFLDTDNPLENTKKDQLLNEIKEFFKKHTQMSAEQILQIYHGILFYVLSYCNKRGIDTSGILKFTSVKGLLRSEKNMEKWCIELIGKMIPYDEEELQDDKISAVKKYIKENYMNQISRETISNELFFNASYLSRLFKKSMGMSIFEYLAYVRIEEAQRMLIYTDKKISNIAMEVGYNHFSHFANIFRRLTGLTPKEYREQNKAGDKKDRKE